MNKKTWWAIIIIMLILGAAGGYWYFQKWLDAKQMKIQLGLAGDKFPWRDFSQEELDKMYPQIKYADVPTRVTPEQTYANFREALRTNNLEMAVEQLAKESKRSKETVDTLKDFYKDGKFQELYKRYPKKITKANTYEAIAQYEYDYYSDQYKQDLIGTIDFSKDVNGDWKMDSL